MDDRLTELERGLTEVLRNGNLYRLHEHLVDIAGVSLDRAAYGVLGTLQGARGIRLSELAQRLGIDVSTASRHVANLEGSGLVRRVADPSDRRAVMLDLTEAGDETLDRVRLARRRLLAEVLRDWDEHDVATLATLLERLGADLARFLEPRSAPTAAG